MLRHILVAASAVVALLPAPGAAQTTAPETRAIWVSRFEWPSSNQATAKANIDRIMSNIADNHFNTVLFQVRGQCDVHYPSPYEPWSNTYGWTNPGWDPLAYAIEAAHSRGLEFHAYINTHTMAAPVPPAVTVPQHIYNLHGPGAPPGQNWLIHDSGGVPAGLVDSYYWLSPGIPEASWHTRRAILHVVRNYDVDGVHFDRIRTPGPGYSYDPITVARFNGDGNPDRLGWADFMRSQITRDLRNIHGEIMRYKPWVKTSAAPFGIMYKDATTNYQGTGTQAYHQWYQDGWGWLQSRVLDFMVPQIYWTVGSAHPFEKLLADWQARRGDRLVVAGSTTGSGTKALSDLLAEHQQTRLQSAAGHCIFSVGSMTNYWAGFKSGPYAAKAPVAEMPWKTAPTQGHIVGYVRDMSGAPVLDAKVNLAGDPYHYLSAWDGFFAIIYVAPGTTATLTATKAGLGTGRVSNVAVTAGQATVVEITLRNSRGTVTMDRASYQFGVSPVVTLVDSDLAGSGTAVVRMSSTSDTGGETVTLAETQPASGVFATTVPLSFGAPMPGNGELEVALGDTITVLYEDADTGLGEPGVSSATATVVAVPDIIIESRQPNGAQTLAPRYQEFLTSGGVWGNTTAKSAAPGLTGSGARWTGDNSLGAYAVFRPEIVSPGRYHVYVTGPNATAGPNVHSPGAGFRIVGAAGEVSGTFDLSRLNPDLADKWYLLAADVEMQPGGGASLTITNNNPASANTGQRFNIDAVKFVWAGWHKAAVDEWRAHGGPTDNRPPQRRDNTE
ncbi:MAG: family 10 glycosylhydrolase [Candidatus Sumerlaeaceae bacterium]|nr:family 10 glycosylhydrolase [Candidatus Sumerlaeaceae bacterium]